MEYEIKDFQYYLESGQKKYTKSKLLYLGIKASEAAFDLEKRKIFPDIGFGGFFESGNTVQSIQGLTLTDDYNDPFNYKRVGVGIRLKGDINIPKYRAKVGQAQAQYFKAAISQSIAKAGIELDLKDSYFTLIHTKKVMDNGHDAMKAARQFVFLTKSNLDIGVGDKKEYSDALQAYLVTRGRYLEAIYNYNIAIGTLESKIADYNEVFYAKD
jgi:outer membrane protein TolC